MPRPPFKIKMGCNHCEETFEGARPSEVFEARRFHMEQRHLAAKIETDT